MNPRHFYFRKLARVLQPKEYQRVKALRSPTGQISIPELLFLRWAIRRFKPQIIVEIGSLCGASTALMADQIRQLGAGRIHAIDLFSLSQDRSRGKYWKAFEHAMAPYEGWVEKLEGDSKFMPWDEPIDLLFIDGDHSEAGVSADIAKYTPFVRVGGCVLLHDYLDSPEHNSFVKTVVDRTLMRDPAYRTLGQVGSLLALHKIVHGRR